MKRKLISSLLAISLFLGIIAPITVSAEEAEEEKVGVVGSSITLAENIILYAKLRITDDNAYSVEVISPGGSSNTYKLSDNKTDDNFYILPAEIFIKNLFDNVTYNVLSESGEKIATYYTSAADYCESYKTHSPNGIYKDLISALESYGEISARYFSKQTGVDEIKDADFSSVPNVVVKGKLPAGIVHESATLILESETTLRHYFTVSEGHDVSDYKFFLDLDNDNKCSTDMPEELTPVFNDTYCYIEIPAISPNELSIVYKIGVSDGANTYTCAYGALTYAKNIYNRSSAPNSRNLAAAILAYSNAADGFMGTEAPSYTIGPDNFADATVFFGDANLINEIKQTPESERIITLRVDFTALYVPDGNGYLQILKKSGNYKLAQLSDSYAKPSTNIVSPSTLKFLKNNVENSYSMRLEIVIDYTRGEIRYYMNGLQFFAGKPSTELPEWDTLGNSTGKSLFSLTNAMTFDINGAAIYIGATGK